MNQKMKSALMPLVGLGIVVVSFSMEQDIKQVENIDWGSVALWGSILGWAMGWLAKSPKDAHAIDKKGTGRLP